MAAAASTGGSVEYWAHEASLIPVENHPLFRWRMDERDRMWAGMRRVLTEREDLLAETLELVRDCGPIRARDTGHVRPKPVAGEMWNWHDGKLALRVRCSSPARSGHLAPDQFRTPLRPDRERILPAAAAGWPDAHREVAHRELGQDRRHSAGGCHVGGTLPTTGESLQEKSGLRVAELVATGELDPR